MENKNKLNPLVSGGILVNDNDYFEKDKVNMEKDSLKASLALLTKIKNQKKNEINALQNTYLKEESQQQSTQNDTNVFDTPVMDKTEKSIKSEQATKSSPLSRTSFVIPEEAVYTSQTPHTAFSVSDNISIQDTVQTPQNQNVGISIQDLDNTNQNELLGKKDEYVPDYRNETYQEQAQNMSEQIQTPMYSVNQTDAIDPNQFMMNDSAPQETPKYVIDDTKGYRKGHAPVATNEEIKSGKGVAWLAYIVFFLPLLFNSKNKFVRWHANEGIKLFFLDIIGAGLFCVGWFLKSTNEIYTLLLLASLTAGTVIIAISVFTRIVMIPFALAGKEAQHPWLFHKHRIIK